ncbi:MAG TPA: hypothetical protein DD426_00860, partial [Clostridiaceae bacterium]|nr:hypothetical protein [Clostridiaceae bacterium]
MEKHLNSNINMKSEILKLLKKGDGFVSGEEISSIFNVSRA